MEGPPMSATVIIASVAAVLLAGGGFLAGRATAPSDAELLAQQTSAIQAVADGNTALVAEVQKVANIEAEKEANIADKLTDVPPMCVTEVGGDPLSPQCMWAWCVRTGESTGQRCEVSPLTTQIIAERNLDLRKADLAAWETRLKKREAACPEPSETP